MLNEKEAWESVQERVKEGITGHSEAVGYNVEAALENLRDLAAALHVSGPKHLWVLTLEVLRRLSEVAEHGQFLLEQLEDQFGSDESDPDAPPTVSLPSVRIDRDGPAQGGASDHEG